MKKGLTIYIDDCVDGITDICATFVQSKATGSTKVYMMKARMAEKDAVHLPWNGEPRWFKEDGDEKTS